jgi:uncharacterized protein YjbI with pentapeptide repeats
MFEPFSTAFLLWFTGAAIFLIVLAGATWLFVPGWLAARLSIPDKSRLELEDSYRKALAQIIGFPLALLGAFGVCVAVFQALATYQSSQRVEYQNQYQRGFESLGSKSVAVRIGGLYILQTLVDPAVSELQAKTSADGRDLTLLRALAAFAVEQRAKTDEIVHPDALTALQILAFRKAQPNVGFDLRTGKFSGSVLADDPTKRYPDFRHFDLYKADLSGSGLYRALLYEANLRLANLNGSNLAGADLSHAGLSGTTFCPGLNFAVPAMVRPYPVPVEMGNATFYSSTGDQTRFDGAHMNGSILNDSEFVSPGFVGTILEGTKFVNTSLENPDFSQADLKDASFEGAMLIKPVFAGAVLIGTNLHVKGGISDDDLQGAYLCNVTGPSGKKLSDDCDKAEKERAKRLNPPSAITCKSP